MYQIFLCFKSQSKKLTLPSNLSSSQLQSLISHTFHLRQSILGFTSTKGLFLNIGQLQKSLKSYTKQTFYIITSQDVREDNMSFDRDYYHRQRDNKRDAKQIYKRQNDKREFDKKGINKREIDKRDNKLNYHKDMPSNHDKEIPSKLEGNYQGVIGDLQMFQELFLQQNQVIVVFNFVKEKPKNIAFPYYLYHTSKNSAIVYVGHSRVCQFFIQQMCKLPQQVQRFILSLIKPSHQGERQKSAEQQAQSPQQNKIQTQINQQNQKQYNQQNQQHHDNVENEQNEQNQEQSNLIQESQDEQNDRIQDEHKQQQIKLSLMQNLQKLRHQEEITELQFYRMKSELLQSLSDFMRKYQMGTRKGLRRQKSLAHKLNTIYTQNQRQTCQNLTYQKNKGILSNHNTQHMHIAKTPSQYPNQIMPTSSHSYRTKKYQIPIIVRKYNNVIQKISTSYPLSHQQQQAINLILELELKGLVSEKQSGIYKSCILQEDPEIFPFFIHYFQGLLDQLQLVHKLNKVKHVNSEKRQRGQHNMRLLIKYAKQTHYQILRNLLLQKNNHLLNSLDRFRTDKNTQRLIERLQAIAQMQKQRLVLQDILH